MNSGHYACQTLHLLNIWNHYVAQTKFPVDLCKYSIIDK